MIRLVKYREKILILAIVVLAVLIRIIFAVIHFTHYDDVGLIVSILQNGDGLLQKLHYKNIIPWTYAPLQCWIIALLINSKYSYAVNLFLGRFPSLVFSITNIFLMISFVKKVYPNKLQNVMERVLSVIMISFSWELIIYAAQCEPYSIGITGVLLLIHTYMDSVNKEEIPIIKTVLIGAVVGYMQYQLFVFALCFYVALFINFFSDKRTLFKCMACSIISLAIDVPVIIDFLKSGMFERGLNWNVGNNMQYSFNLSVYKGKDAIRYTINYFVQNIFEYFRSMFIYKTTTWYSILITLAVVMAFILGIIYSFRKKDKMNNFFISVMLVSFILIITGKLTLSPSRHTIIYIPICIYYIVRGVTCIRQLENYIFTKCMFVLSMCIVLIFLLDFPSEYMNRKNKISERIVSEWCEQIDPVYVGFYKDTFDLDLMRIPGYCKAVGGIQKENAIINVGDKIIFYSRAREIMDSDLEYLENSLDGNKLMLLSSDEQPSDTEVEYAEGSFFNFGNGYYFYTYLVVDPNEK